MLVGNATPSKPTHVQQLQSDLTLSTQVAATGPTTPFSTIAFQVAPIDAWLAKQNTATLKFYTDDYGDINRHALNYIVTRHRSTEKVDAYQKTIKELNHRKRWNEE